MALLTPIRRLFSRAAQAMAFMTGKQATPSPDDDYWYRVASFATASGIEVTPENAMRVGTVYACVRVLSETMASLPLHVYEQLGDDEGKRMAVVLPIYDVLHGDRPNLWQTHFEWIEMLMGHIILAGNAYCRKIPGERGAVDQLLPLNPRRMRVYRLANGLLLYEFSNLDGRKEFYRQDEMFHVRGFSSDGVIGMSVIESAQEAIGLATAAERHGSAVFKNYARPGVVLKHPGKLKPEARENLRASWERIHAGSDNAHKTAVLEEGMGIEAIGFSNEDAQLLETRQYQRTEICGLFRVPPHMVGDLSKIAYNQLEHQDTAFAKHTMLPWCRRWEGAIQRDLIGEDAGLYARFNLNGLQRGDLAARTTHYQSMLAWGVYSINEVRALEDLNPVEGGDTHFVPLNMQTLEEAVQEPEPVPPALQGFQRPPPALPPPEEEEEEEEEEEGGEPGAKGVERQVLRRLIADGAARIAHKELGGLTRHVKHAAEDRARFDGWALKFYAALHDYVLRTLAPIAAACEAARGWECSAQALANYLTAEGPRQLCACDPAAVVARWATGTRAEDLARLLEEEWLAPR